MTAPFLLPCADGWSPRRVEQLRLHHALGLTAAQSAGLLGGVTRNAVISKRARLGLQAVRIATPILTSRPSPVRFRPGVTPPPKFRCEPLPSMDFPLPAMADPKRLCDRAPRECAWPLGPADEEGDHLTLFCCAPIVGRGVYCGEHRTLAHPRVEPSVEPINGSFIEPSPT